jgi:hypothetical protein
VLSWLPWKEELGRRSSSSSVLSWLPNCRRRFEFALQQDVKPALSMPHSFAYCPFRSSPQSFLLIAFSPRCPFPDDQFFPKRNTVCTLPKKSHSLTTCVKTSAAPASLRWAAKSKSRQHPRQGCSFTYQLKY